MLKLNSFNLIHCTYHHIYHILLAISLAGAIEIETIKEIYRENEDPGSQGPFLAA